MVCGGDPSLPFRSEWLKFNPIERAPTAGRQQKAWRQLSAGYGIGRCNHTPPGPIFQGRYLHSCSWSGVGAKKVDVGKHPAESFPKTYRSVLALAPSRLSRNRARITASRGGGDIRGRIRYFLPAEDNWPSRHVT